MLPVTLEWSLMSFLDAAQALEPRPNDLAEASDLTEDPAFGKIW